METSMEKEYIVVRESLFQSVTSDIFTTFSLIGSFWLNSQYIDSFLFEAFILLTLFLFSLNRLRKKSRLFNNAEDAITFLRGGSE